MPPYCDVCDRPQKRCVCADDKMLQSDSGGIKDAKGKTEYSLLPWETIKGAAEVMTLNIKENGGKYPRDNWKNFDHEEAIRLYLDAVMRHRDKMLAGEWLDPEDGKSHASHIVCDAAMADWHMAQVNEFIGAFDNLTGGK